MKRARMTEIQREKNRMTRVVYSIVIVYRRSIVPFICVHEDSRKLGRSVYLCGFCSLYMAEWRNSHKIECGCVCVCTGTSFDP